MDESSFVPDDSNQSYSLAENITVENIPTGNEIQQLLNDQNENLIQENLNISQEAFQSDLNQDIQNQGDQEIQNKESQELPNEDEQVIPQDPNQEIQNDPNPEPQNCPIPDPQSDTNQEIQNEPIEDYPDNQNSNENDVPDDVKNDFRPIPFDNNVYSLTEVENSVSRVDTTQSTQPDSTRERPETGMVVEDNVVPFYVSDEEPPGPKPFRLQQTISTSQLPPLGTTPENDQECERILRAYETNHTLPPVDFRGRLIQYIQREKINAIVKQNYKTANRYQVALQNLTNDITTFEQKDKYKMELESLQDKIQETDEKVKALEAETQDLIQSQQTADESRRISLKVNHREEMEQFEAHWNDTNFLKIFEKPSPQLLQLQKTERQMVLAKMFARAEDIRKKITELEIVESNQAQERAYAEMEKQRDKILARQNQEMNVFLQHSKTTISNIRRSQEVKMRALLARQNKLKKELAELQKTSSPPKISSVLSNDEAPMTPRTAERYTIYKSNISGPKLSVKPLGSIWKKNTKRKGTISATPVDL